MSANCEAREVHRQIVTYRGRTPGRVSRPVRPKIQDGLAAVTPQVPPSPQQVRQSTPDKVPMAPEIKPAKEDKPSIDYERIIKEVMDRMPTPSPGVDGGRGEPGPPGPPAEVDFDSIISQVLDRLPESPPGPPGKDADEDEIVRRVTQSVLQNFKRSGSFTITVPTQ